MQRFLIKDTAKHVGEKVRVCGWVNTYRAHGKILFIDLRDISGILQVVFVPSNNEAYELAKTLRPEWVVEIVGHDYFNSNEPLIIDLADKIMSLLPRGRESFRDRFLAVNELGLSGDELRKTANDFGICTQRRSRKDDPMLDVIMEILYHRSDDLTLVEQKLLITVDQAVCDLDFLTEGE
jgi:hypothetical protein